jgi:hypothetical protein
MPYNVSPVINNGIAGFQESKLLGCIPSSDERSTKIGSRLEFETPFTSHDVVTTFVLLYVIWSWRQYYNIIMNGRRSTPMQETVNKESFDECSIEIMDISSYSSTANHRAAIFQRIYTSISSFFAQATFIAFITCISCGDITSSKCRSYNKLRSFSRNKGQYINISALLSTSGRAAIPPTPRRSTLGACIFLHRHRRTKATNQPFTTTSF